MSLGGLGLTIPNGGVGVSRLDFRCFIPDPSSVMLYHILLFIYIWGCIIIETHLTDVDSPGRPSLLCFPYKGFDRLPLLLLGQSCTEQGLALVPPTKNLNER
jgi:hypothetical protein